MRLEQTLLLCNFANGRFNLSDIMMQEANHIVRHRRRKEAKYIGCVAVKPVEIHFLCNRALRCNFRQHHGAFNLTTGTCKSIGLQFPECYRRFGYQSGGSCPFLVAKLNGVMGCISQWLTALSVTADEDNEERLPPRDGAAIGYYGILRQRRL
jgi:hypothetical protein